MLLGPELRPEPPGGAYIAPRAASCQVGEEKRRGKREMKKGKTGKRASTNFLKCIL